MSLQSDLGAKHVRAFVTGLVKIQFYKEDITEEQLATLFSESKMDEEKIQDYRTNMSAALKQAAFQNWDAPQLTGFLEKSDIEETHKEAFLRVWRTERPKIHAQVSQSSKWTNTLQHLSWRIDLTQSSRSTQTLNEPTAIIQMDLANSSKQHERVVFETNASGITDILSQIETIEAVIESSSNSS